MIMITFRSQHKSKRGAFYNPGIEQFNSTSHSIDFSSFPATERMKPAKCAHNNRRRFDEGMSQLQERDELETLRGEIEAMKLSPPPQCEEDCPVCLVRLPPVEEIPTSSSYYPCCGKVICTACQNEHVRALETMKRRNKKKVKMTSCAFCRTQSPKNDSELIKRYMDRVNKDDVKAITEVADFHLTECYGVPKNETKALLLYHRAADLGDAKACHRLGIIFTKGLLGWKNTSEGMRYLHMAAKKGDVGARCKLGDIEFSAGNFDTAQIYFCSAAKKGSIHAVEMLCKLTNMNKLDKATFKNISHQHDIARNEMRSDDRDRYDAWDCALDGDDSALKNVYSAYYRGKITAVGLNEALKAKQNGVWNKMDLSRALLANSVK